MIVSVIDNLCEHGVPSNSTAQVFMHTVVGQKRKKNQLTLTSWSERHSPCEVNFFFIFLIATYGYH